MSLPSEPTRPSERSKPLVSSQESHLRPNRGAPDGETSTIHPTGWLSVLKAWALPLAVLSLVLNLILIIVIVILSTLITRPADPVAACPDGWVGYRGKCYYFSEPRANWTDSQKNCSAHGASLAGIDSQQEMGIPSGRIQMLPSPFYVTGAALPAQLLVIVSWDAQNRMIDFKGFLVCNKGPFDPWIGLRKELDQTWKWANGTKFNNWFTVAGEEYCAFLSRNNIASSGCGSSRPWICSKPVQKPEGRAK